MCWRSIRWQHLLCLSVILFLAAGIRFHNISRNSLWTDEFLSLECSSGWARSDMSLAGESVAAPDLITLKNARPWTTIWRSIGQDENHPPVYFLLLRFWRDCFGDTPAALRSLSAVASLIAIMLLFAIGVEVHSPSAALWACLLMAVASPQIQQAQDARAYMPVTAACLAAALFLVRINRLGPTRFNCIGLFLAAMVAPLMHYMAFASIAAMFVYAILVMRGPNRKWAVISLASCLATFLLLWGPQMLQQHYRMLDDTVWLVDTQNDHAGSVLKDLCSLPVRLFLDLDPQSPGIACCGVVVFALPLLMWRHRQVRLWWIWLVVPAAIALVIDLSTQRRTLSMTRYTLAAAPAVYLMMGMLAAHLRRTGWIPAAIIAACCAACIPSSYVSQLPDYRELPRFVASSSRPTDPVIFVSSHPDPIRRHRFTERDLLPGKPASSGLPAGSRADRRAVASVEKRSAFMRDFRRRRLAEDAHRTRPDDRSRGASHRHSPGRHRRPRRRRPPNVPHEIRHRPGVESIAADEMSSRDWEVSKERCAIRR